MAVTSGKGGVGKTTVACAIANCIAETGRNVGVLDADVTGSNVMEAFGLDEYELELKGMKIIPKTYKNMKIISSSTLAESPEVPILASGELKRKIISQMVEAVDWSGVEYLIVDMPPGASDELIESVRSAGPSLVGAVIVSTPSSLSAVDVNRMIKIFQKMAVPILSIVWNMEKVDVKCPKCGHSFSVELWDGDRRLRRMKCPIDRVPYVGGITALDTEFWSKHLNETIRSILSSDTITKKISRRIARYVRGVQI